MSEEPREQAARPKRRRVKVGTVHSLSGDRTIHVVVNNLVKHPMYGKYIARRTKLAVHDPQSAAKRDDVVEIAPCRRVSKTKSWRLVRIVRRGEPTAPVPGQEE